MNRPLEPMTQREVRNVTAQNLLIAVAKISANAVRDDARQKWQEELEELFVTQTVLFDTPPSPADQTTSISKPIEWHKDWMSALGTFDHEHWGGLTSFGNYLVEHKMSKYVATASFGGRSYIGCAPTSEEAFQMCQDDLEARLKEMLA